MERHSSDNAGPDPCRLSRRCFRPGARSRCASGGGARDLRDVLHGDQGKTLSKLERLFTAPVQLPGVAGTVIAVAVDLDRKRERQAYARGDQFRRFTWGDVV